MPALGTGLVLGLACGAISHLLHLELVLPGYPRSSLVVAAWVGLALVLTWRGFDRSLRFISLALVALALVVMATPLTRLLASDLVRTDPLGPADAIYVFASSQHRDGTPNSASFVRLLHGVELAASGRAPRLVVSHGPPPVSNMAAMAEGWLRTFHVPAELLVVGPVHDTHEEGQAVARLLRERGLHRVIAVTSPLHSRRAAEVLESEGLSVISSPSMETRFDANGFPDPEDRIAAFGSVLHDFIGLRIYEWRGYIGVRRSHA